MKTQHTIEIWDGELYELGYELGNHLLEGRADGPRPQKFEFMMPKI